MGRRSVFKNATLVYWIATITATLAALGATAVGAEPPSLSYLQQDRCSMMSDKLIQATEKAHDLCGKIGKSKKDKKKDSKSTNPASDGTGYETSFTDCQKQAKACEGVSIEVGGHTDSTGSAAGNKTLSDRRANAVMNYLTKAGVPASSITAVGYGQDKPVATNDTADGKRQNRRIEFTVTSK